METQNYTKLPFFVLSTDVPAKLLDSYVSHIAHVKEIVTMSDDISDYESTKETFIRTYHCEVLC